MSKEAVFKLDYSCGRQGDLDGVFIATLEQVDVLVEEGIEIYFGEVLGKHSEIYGPIDDGEIIFITDDEKVVKLMLQYDLTMGHNPFNYTSINFDYESYGIEDEDDEIGTLVNKIIEKRKEK
jgi:hypothetical protein